MRSTTTLRKIWSPACKNKLERIDLVPGVTIAVHHQCVEAFTALGDVMEAHGYKVRQKDTGSYNCRQITGGKGYSLHAYGISADVNWGTNPYAKKLITDMPKEMIADIKAIKTTEGKPVFRWGGDYKSVKDAMHFEVVASPAELAKGIADVSSPRPASGEPVNPMADGLLSMGDKGEIVGVWQQQLKDTAHKWGGSEDIDVDSAFGPQTEKATKDFQKAMGLTVDGIVGPDTFNAMEQQYKATPEPESEPETTEQDPEPLPEDQKGPKYEIAVRYSADKLPDHYIAQALSAGLWHVAPHTNTATVGTVYLVGAEAVRSYNRALATNVVELAGADRLQTFDRAMRIVRDRVAKAV